MILVIDNYDSFTYNLVHLVGRGGTEVRVIRNDRITPDEIRDLNPAGILISPGPGRPESAGVSLEVVETLGQEVPILGVCLGHQAIGMAFGGEVIHAPSLMHGKTSLIVHAGTGIFHGIEHRFVATRYHSLVVSEDSLPNSLEVTARTPDGVVMGLRHRQFPIEGIQFHPESILTEAGPRIIDNWLNTVRSTDSEVTA